MWNDARSVVETGRDLFQRSWFQALYISYGDFKLPVYIWGVTLLARFVNDPFWAVRLPSLLAGVSMIPLIAWLSYSLLGKKYQVWAVWSAAVMAILPWSLHFSHVGYEGHVSAAFLLGSVALLVWSARQPLRSAWLPILASAFFGSAAVYTYFSTRFVWPVVVGTFCVLWWQHARRVWPALLFGLFIWGLSLVPMYRADFYQASNQFRLSAANILNQPERPHEINAYRMRAGNTVWARLIYNRPTFLLRDAALNYLAYLDPEYLFVSGDPNLRHGMGQSGLMYLSFLPLFLIGIGSLVRKHLKLAVWMFVWWIAAILPAAIPQDVPHALRSLNALPVFVLLVSWGCFEVWQWMRQKRSLFSRALVAFLGLFLTAEVFRWLWLYGAYYPRVSAAEWQDGYRQAAQYLSSIRDKYVFVYVDEFDERFFLYYQPFSGMTYQEIQELPSQNFQREIYKNVHIRPIDDWLTLEHNSVVLTRRDKLPSGWSIHEVVKNTFGEEEFVVVETPRD